MKKAIITSAVALSASQKKSVAAAIELKYGSDVVIEEVVDHAVIGGLKLTIDSLQIDASIAGKLNQLQSQLHESVHAE